ncbi:MAG: TM2 domain-containing protein [Clostridia bacterium]|nr:TM2 domain-containing protein [Clostridia bacterium]
MYCKQCGESINPNQAICVKCGVKVGEGNNYCSNCGKTIDPTASVCLNCGFAVKKNINSDKMMLAIVALLVGTFGIHNFMMGESKKGIVKILLCWTGISSIIALIDAIKLFTDKYEVDSDKYF